MGDMVPQDPDANPFIDNEALGELRDKVIDTLRPLGLTVDPDSMVFQMHPEQGMVVMIPALVRPSAKEKMDSDKASREEFNKMMADQAEAKIESTVGEIEKLLDKTEGMTLEALFFGGDDAEEEEDACKHENMHPSGFCLDCNEGLKEGLE